MRTRTGVSWIPQRTPTVSLSQLGQRKQLSWADGRGTQGSEGGQWGQGMGVGGTRQEQGWQSVRPALWSTRAVTGEVIMKDHGG